MAHFVASPTQQAYGQTVRAKSKCGGACDRCRTPVFRGAAKGQSLVEFSLIFPIMMIVLLALLQWSHMLFVNQILQNAVREAGRNALVGNTNAFGQSYTSPEAAARQKLYANSLGLLPNPNAKVTFSNTGTTNSDFGGPTAVFTIRVDYPYNYHTPLVGFFNAIFAEGGQNNFNNHSNLVISSTFQAEKYDNEFLF